MTFESKEIVIEIIEHNGVYQTDPQMSSVWSYKGIGNKQLFAVFSDEGWNDIHSSPYVYNSILLWSHKKGLTKKGEEFLEENKHE